MANKEYIERSEALKAMDNLLHQHFLNVPDSATQAAATAGYMDGVKDADIRLRSIFAADVRPVVFCKDCRHRDPEDHKCDSGETERQGCPFKVADDYFCAYGER